MATNWLPQDSRSGRDFQNYRASAGSGRRESATASRPTAASGGPEGGPVRGNTVDMAASTRAGLEWLHEREQSDPGDFRLHDIDLDDPRCRRLRDGLLRTRRHDERHVAFGGNAGMPMLQEPMVSFRLPAHGQD